MSLSVTGIGGIVGGPAPPVADDGGEDGSLAIVVILGVLSVLVLAGLTLFVRMRRGRFPGRARLSGVREAPALAWLLGTLVVWLAMMAGGAVASSLARGGMREVMLSSLCAGISAMLVGRWLRRGLSARAMTEAGLRFGVMDVAVGGVAFALAMPIVGAALWGSSPLYTALTGLEPPTVLHSTLAEMVSAPRDGWFWGAVLGICVAVPVGEELVFRVGLQSALLRTFGKRCAAVLGASLLFTVLHLAPMRVGGPGVLILVSPIFVLSVCLGAAYEWTGRPGVPMVMHGLFNAGNIALAMWMEPQSV